MCWLEKADPCLSEWIIEGSDRLIDSNGSCLTGPQIGALQI
jgi:hypothetical protein